MSENTTAQTTATQDLEDKVAAAFGDVKTISPYKLIGIVNELLASFEVDKVLPTQMGYQYANKGYIKGVVRSERETKGGKKVETLTVTREGAVEWATKYVTAQLTK